jgi:serine phosphatase RsbU (regulator of sigma subunit)
MERTPDSEDHSQTPSSDSGEDRVSDADERTAAYTSLFEPGAVAERIHVMVVVDGHAKGERIEISGEPVVIGRGSKCDLILEDAKISSRHCAVALTSGNVMVSDLGSTNGTFVDGKRVDESVRLPPESLLHVGMHTLKHEFRDRADADHSARVEADLEQARAYVQSLLPAPVQEGDVRVDWFHVPTAGVGGEAFEYHSLFTRYFVMYMIDVCGEGTGAALHSVAVINVLRKQTLPSCSFKDPAPVFTGLNEMFQMAVHGDMYFTAWGGVYDRTMRTLTYSSAGHPAAVLVGPDRREQRDLQTHGMAIGMARIGKYMSKTIDVAPGSMLQLFSDGVYDIKTKPGSRWSLAALKELFAEPPPEGGRWVEHVHDRVLRESASDRLQADFSFLAISFD